MTSTKASRRRMLGRNKLDNMFRDTLDLSTLEKDGKADALPHQQKKKAEFGSGWLPELNSSKSPGTNMPLKAKLQSTHSDKTDQRRDSMLPQINQGRVPEQTPGRTKEQRRSSEFRFLQENRSGRISTQGLSHKQDCERLYEGHPLPMTSIDVLNLFGERLTPYEKVEIMGYSEIWYLGLDAEKINASPQKKRYNFRYDDKMGTYIKVLHDHIAYRYEVLGVVGEGAFGKVFKCLDHKTNEMVVIKMLSHKLSFDPISNVEVKILDALRKEDCKNSCNVIHMKDYFRFRNHLCITFELLGPNLHDLMEMKHFEGLSEPEVRRYARELLKCLQMLRKKKIIHCDLKPDNILLSQKGKGIKVIDFGCSCYEHERLYKNVGTLPYSAPEVLLGQSYDCSIDMWSLGCTLAELFRGVELFTGDTEAEHLACVMEVLGLPPSSFLQTGSRTKLFFNSLGQPKDLTSMSGRIRYPGSKSLEGVLRTNNHLFLDFIERCLTWDPAKRLTPEDALRHEWIQQGHRKSRPGAQAVRLPEIHNNRHNITPREISCREPCGRLKPLQITRTLARQQDGDHSVWESGENARKGTHRL